MKDASDTFRTLDKLAQQLPFPLDAIEEVNVTFLRSREPGEEDCQRYIEIWTYCFCWRYFLVKFVQDGAMPPGDLELLLTRALLRIRDKRQGVTTYYASWVGVLCKNLYLNYLRDRRLPVSLDAYEGLELAAPAGQDRHDLGLAQRALRSAFERLPPSLRDIARLRLLEGFSYDEIGQRTGQELQTVRTYMHKAFHKLRQDPGLRAFWHLFRKKM